MSTNAHTQVLKRNGTVLGNLKMLKAHFFLILCVGRRIASIISPSPPYSQSFRSLNIKETIPPVWTHTRTAYKRFNNNMNVFDKSENKKFAEIDSSRLT